MEPIISPWIIYVISVLDNIRQLFILAITLTLVFAVVYFIHTDVEGGDLNIPLMKKCIIAVAIFSIILTIIPSSELAYKMLAAQFVTPDNVNAATNYGLDLIDKIAEIIANRLK